MTAEEFWKNNLMFSGSGNVDYEFSEVLREFAKLKCQELLEIVAEKAETKKEYLDPFLKPDIIIDKNSILNAVDLNEFIK